MRKIILVVFACFVVYGSCQLLKKKEKLPTTVQEALDRMEAIDIDNVLANDRILTSYLKCLLNKGPCTSEANGIKKFIAVLIETKCGVCTVPQRKIIKKCLSHIKNRKQKEYHELIKLYDPAGKRAKELEEFLEQS